MSLLNNWPHPIAATSQMYSPLTGMSGGSSVFPQPQSQHSNHAHAHHANVSQGPNSQHQGSGNSMNMFVLSTAPKMSYEHMVAQDVINFQQARQRQQQHSSHSAGHFHSAVATPHSTGMNLESSGNLDENHFYPGSQMSTMQDQIYRFAEIRSLFQMPSSADIDEPFIRHQGSAHRGHNANLIDEMAQAKLQESIERHKERLVRSRQPKPKSTPHVASPRGRIHRPTHPAPQPSQSAQNDYFRGYAPDSSRTDHNESRQLQNHPPSSSLSSNNAHGVRTAPAQMSNMDGVSAFESTMSDFTEMAPPQAVASPKLVPSGGSVTQHSHSSFITASELSALLDPPRLLPDASQTEFGQLVQGSTVTSGMGGEGPAIQQKVVLEMTLEEFEAATKRYCFYFALLIYVFIYSTPSFNSPTPHY